MDAIAAPDVIKHNSAIIKKWYYEDSPRRIFFNQLLNHLAPQPLKIVQVGAIEEISLAWRIWSGWSDVHFGMYIKQHGGSLAICDINEQHLRNSAFLAEVFGYRETIATILGKAEEIFLTHSATNWGTNLLSLANIIYLDGANDPEETLLQLQYIRTDKSIVIVDDWEIKGQAIDRDQWPFQIMPISQELSMGLLDVRKTT